MGFMLNVPFINYCTSRLFLEIEARQKISFYSAVKKKAILKSLRVDEN